MGDQMFFQFEININVLFKSFRLIWIPTGMLWLYGHYNLFNSYSVGWSLDVKIHHIRLKKASAERLTAEVTFIRFKGSPRWQVNSQPKHLSGRRQNLDVKSVQQCNK